MVMIDQLHALEEGKMPGVSRTLTFAEIHFKAIEPFKFGVLENPQFFPIERSVDGAISQMLVFRCRESRTVGIKAFSPQSSWATKLSHPLVVSQAFGCHCLTRLNVALVSSIW